MKRFEFIIIFMFLIIAVNNIILAFQLNAIQEQLEYIKGMTEVIYDGFS